VGSPSKAPLPPKNEEEEMVTSRIGCGQQCGGGGDPVKAARYEDRGGEIEARDDDTRENAATEVIGGLFEFRLLYLNPEGAFPEIVEDFLHLHGHLDSRAAHP